MKKYHGLTVISLYLRLVFKGLACGPQLVADMDRQLGGCYMKLLCPLWTKLCPLWTEGGC